MRFFTVIAALALAATVFAAPIAVPEVETEGYSSTMVHCADFLVWPYEKLRRRPRQRQKQTPAAFMEGWDVKVKVRTCPLDITNSRLDYNLCILFEVRFPCEELGVAPYTYQSIQLMKGAGASGRLNFEFHRACLEDIKSEDMYDSRG
jgi:hypothetical protein